MFVHVKLVSLFCCAVITLTMVTSSPVQNKLNKTRTLTTTTTTTTTEILENRNSTSNTQMTPLPQRVATTVPCAKCANKAELLKTFTDSNDIGRKDVAEEIKNFRIDEIKAKILQKLRMSERPNNTMPKAMLPEPLSGELQYLFGEQAGQNYNVEDHDYGITERVIFIAENDEYPICFGGHHEPAGCFSFKFTKEIFNENVASAELWVYKLRDKRDAFNQTFVVSEILPPTTYSHITKRHNIVSIRETSVKNGWVKFDLSNTLRRWLRKSRTYTYTLRISCKTCVMNVEDIPVSNDPGEKPFIVINFNTMEQHKRAKRNDVCDSNTVTCCKESLYVNFSQIGWGDWIIAPEGYWANYCRGRCIVAGTSQISHFATVMQHVITRTNLTSAQIAQLSPCCTATKLSSLSLLYTTDNGTITYHLLPNMVVESCGCI